VDLGAPAAEYVDNLGSWNLFSFHAKYGATKENKGVDGKKKERKAQIVARR